MGNALQLVETWRERRVYTGFEGLASRYTSSGTRKISSLGWDLAVDSSILGTHAVGFEIRLRY